MLFQIWISWKISDIITKVFQLRVILEFKFCHLCCIAWSSIVLGMLTVSNFLQQKGCKLCVKRKVCMLPISCGPEYNHVIWYILIAHIYIGRRGSFPWSPSRPGIRWKDLRNCYESREKWLHKLEEAWIIPLHTYVLDETDCFTSCLIVRTLLTCKIMCDVSTYFVCQFSYKSFVIL